MPAGTNACSKSESKRMFVNWPSGGVSWKGVGILKQPVDLFLQHQIIWHTKPDVLVELGTWQGGSAVWYAETGVRVVTVDIQDQVKTRHPDVTYLLGSSSDPEIIRQVRNFSTGRVMVVLDSAHDYQTVRGELDVYADLVSRGCYLIVEDTAMEGPAKALREWRDGHPEFRADATITATEHPGGYLVRR